MIDLSIEENHELYSYQREYDLGRGQMAVHDIVWELETNQIVVLQRMQKIKLNKDEIKGLILSLFKGVPIGEITMWELNAKNPILLQQSWEIFNRTEKLPKRVKLILNGFQRCAAFAVVFSKENLFADQGLRGINLYYNLFKDKFKFEEEIEQLDETWVNLKDTYAPSPNFLILPKKSFDTKFTPILEKLRNESYDKWVKIRFRIDRVFGLVNMLVNYSLYRGNNTNFASDIVYFRNFKTKVHK